MATLSFPVVTAPLGTVISNVTSFTITMASPMTITAPVITAPANTGGGGGPATPTYYWS